MEIKGRTAEKKLLQSLYDERESSFLAIYGRRRVGKTYLVRQFFEKDIVFECSGLHQKSMSRQLENFWLALRDANPAATASPMPKTWLQAFFQLRTYLNTFESERKKVVFLDEISWFETPRSGFLAAVDSFWNQYCTKRTDIILVICGSAASWIIEKVINDRGGLHNRLTHRILLKPFTLRETQDFLSLNHVQMPLKDIAQLYTCVGGIPYYLKDIQAGFSVPQILDQLFFDEQAKLKNEFQNLYASLFKNSDLHEKVVEALAGKNKGLTRSDIVEFTSIKSSGDLTTVLEELTQCDFIRRIYPIDKKKEGFLYRLIDEYTLFYFKFLKDKDLNSLVRWTQTPAYSAWSGYAFENLCFKHTAQIKKALGISGIITNEYSYAYKGKQDEKGTQIDLVIDRADNCINLIEVKFHNKEFEMTQEYARQLSHQMAIFKEKTKTRKAVFLTMLSVFGVVKNQYYLSVATNQLLLEDLFA